MADAAQRLSLHTQQTPLGVIEFDPRLVVVEWNTVAERLFGYRRAEAVGRHAFDLIVSEEARKLVDQVWAQVLKDKTGTRSTNTNRTKDGRTIVCEWHNSPILDDRGAVVGVLALVHDISERLQAEEAVRKSAERYRELFENANDLVFTMDLRGTFTSVNRAAERLTGYARAEALTMNFEQLVAPEHLERTKESLARWLSGERLAPLEYEIVTKAGARLPLELSCRLIIENGKPAGIQGIARDVSERRAAEQALHASEDKFRGLVEQSIVGIYIIQDNAFAYVNPKFAEIFGYDAAEIRRMPVDQIVAPVDREMVLDNLRRRVAGEVENIRYSFRGLRRDGTGIVVEVHGSRTHYQGRPAVIGMLLDVTERHRADQALRESERRFRALLGGVQMVSVQVDPLGRVESCNQYLLSLCGWSSPEVIGQDWFEMFTPPELRERQRRGFLRKVKQAAIRTHHESEILTRAGGRRLISWNNTVLRDGNGEVCGTASLGVDITETRRAEAALRASEERYKLAALGANDGLWDWDLEAGRIYLSPRWKSMLGHADEEVGPRPEEWLDRIHPDDARRIDEDLAAHLDARTPHLESEHRLRHKDGSYRWMLVRGMAVRDKDEQVYRLAGSLTDITERKDAEEKLLHDALHDALTGLPNRALLFDRLGHALARRHRKKDALFAVLFLDVDRFKMVNDSLGHMMGDQLLVAIARRLEGIVAPTDSVARLGGDEFVILLEDLDSNARASEMAERIQQALREPFDLGGQEVFASASMGIALGGEQYLFPEEMVRDADTAMYRAKGLGRARHELFQPSMHAHAVALLQLESSLRRAVEREEFTVGWQPIVSLHTGKLRGFEALLRWRHPSRGLVSPAEFIPMAEETGLIVKLGEWVLEKACRQMADWHRRFPAPDPPLTVSVNLSVRQFLQPDLIDRVRRALEESKLDPRCLHLEITESVIMENSTQAAALLKQLAALQVRVHLDDFGTGYSSLAYLHHFRMDALKIDRSFVGRIGPAGEHGEIVRTIVHLARDLRMEVIAEGWRRPSSTSCSRRCAATTARASSSRRRWR